MNQNSSSESANQWRPDRSGSVDDPLIGKILAAKYRITDVLGKGGMSVVYRAQQLPINRTVALKVLLAQYTKDEGSVKRFLQEAKAAGQINHPNVVSIFDFGISEEGTPFLVMDFVEGKSLAQIVAEQGPINYKEVLPLFLQICDGLTTAHEKGIIHRDIKPSNIVIQQTADGQVAKIVDFGIAKILDSDSQHLTKTGEVFGSPFYMSPEQCSGRELDTRSDIYSLGFVFYEVLSGQIPLYGKTSLETMRMHMEEMPESLQRFGPEIQIPLALENVIFKMIAKQRDKRYPSVRAVKHDLEEIYQGMHNGLSGNIKYVSREISRKSRTIQKLAIALSAVSLLLVIGMLLRPYALSAYAQDQYKKGQEAFSKSDYTVASQCLESSSDLGHKLSDAGLESKSLDLLISIYRKEHKTDSLNFARQRKQELIKKELSNLGINENYVDSYVSQQEVGNHIALTDQSKSKTLLLAAKQTSAPDDGQTDEDSLMDRRKTFSAPSPHPVPQAKASSTRAGLPSPTPVPHDKTSKAGLPLQPMPLSGSTNSEAKISRLRTMSRSSTLASASGGSQGGSGGAGFGSPIVDNDPVVRDLRELPKREQPGSPESKNDDDPQDEPSDGKVIASGDSYEKLVAMIDICLERNWYPRAIRCASSAIRMSQALDYPQDEELSELFAKRAFAQLQLHHPLRSEQDLTKALSIVGPRDKSQAGADAECVQAMLYQRSGFKKRAEQTFSHAKGRLSKDVRSPIWQEAENLFRTNQ